MTPSARFQADADGPPSALRHHWPLLVMLAVLPVVLWGGMSPARRSDVVPVRLWRTTVAGDPQAYVEPSGTLVLHQGLRGADVLRGVSSDDGQVRWRARINNWTTVVVEAWGEDRLLVTGYGNYARPPDPPGDAATGTPASDGVALVDARTGKILWTRPWSMDDAEQRTVRLAGQQVLLASDTDVQVLEARTGSLAWTWTAPAGCSVTSADIDAAAGGTPLDVSTDPTGGVVAVSTLCAHQGHLLLLRSGRGTVLHDRIVADPADDVAVSHGVVRVSTPELCRLLTSDGHDLASSRFVTCETNACFWATERVVVTCLDELDTGKATLWAVDRTTGADRWTRPLVGPYNVFLWGDRLAARRDGDLLRVVASGPLLVSPDQEVILDLETGTPRSTLPLAGGASRTGGAVLLSDGSVVERVIDESTGTWAIQRSRGAFPPGPLPAGAPPRDWPDPCALGSSALASLFGTSGVTPLPLRSDSAVGGRGPTVGCRFVPHDAAQAWADLDVAWVAPTPALAEQYVRGRNASEGGFPVPGVGDQAMLVQPTFAGCPDTLDLRVDRIVVRLRLGSRDPDSRDPDSTAQMLQVLGRAVADQLRSRGSAT